jgi:hypothetical protein
MEMNGIPFIIANIGTTITNLLFDALDPEKFKTSAFSSYVFKNYGESRVVNCILSTE